MDKEEAEFYVKQRKEAQDNGTEFRAKRLGWMR
jgi:hypothetical protein